MSYYANLDKARVAFGDRGFESHPLRQNVEGKFVYTAVRRHFAWRIGGSNNVRE